MANVANPQLEKFLCCGRANLPLNMYLVLYACGFARAYDG